ncbi:hypothetical protein U0070_006473 [Myodes glareolus]|uniref:Uncharacterized protein n=1 Tax=Myodes glareolus TaxID=447135 RepID=A0AAW0HSQ5_MYOGA
MDLCAERGKFGDCFHEERLCESVSNIEDLYILMDKNHKGSTMCSSWCLDDPEPLWVRKRGTQFVFDFTKWMRPLQLILEHQRSQFLPLCG